MMSKDSKSSSSSQYGFNFEMAYEVPALVNQNSDHSPRNHTLLGEIFIGIVCPVGVNSGLFVNTLEAELQNYRVTFNRVKVSALMSSLESIRPLVQSSNEYDRISNHMNAGSGLRKVTKFGGILGHLAIKKIHEEREGLLEQAKTNSNRYIVHVVDSFKHPEEAQAFMNLYGNSF